jgi:phage terminase large subunit-like protein
MPFRSKELDPLRQMAAAAVLRQQQLEKAELESVYDWYGLSCPCGLPPGDCEKHPRARLKQRPPGTPGSPWGPNRPWSVFLMQAGRGGGKTRAAAEFVRWKIETGQWKEVIIVGATIGEVIKYQVRGPSGLEKIAPPWSPAHYLPSSSMVYYPVQKARVYLATSEKPKSLRGGNIDGAWSDETGKWEYQQDTWHQIEWVLRNKTTPPPQNIVSTTSTASPVMDDLNEQADREEETPGSTGVIRVEWDAEENRNNLDPTWLAKRIQQWRGTLMGLQELSGKHLRRKEGALWSPDDYAWKGFRVLEVPELEYIGVGVDPQGAAPRGTILTPRGNISAKKSTGAETGIVVAGREPQQIGSYVSRGVVLDDRTLSGTPGEWGKAVVRAYFDWKAHEVVAEKNNGGEMVRHVIETVPAGDGYPSGKNVPIHLVYAATGKTARAEPIQGLYQAHRVRHYSGPKGHGLEALEQQMVQYMPGKSGQLLDRVDAQVWILFRAIIEHDDIGEAGPIVAGLSRQPFTYNGQVTPWMLP